MATNVSNKLPKIASRITTHKNGWIRQGTGKQIASISSSSLEPCSSPVGSEFGIDLLCSYNWGSAVEPAIYVPGMLLDIKRKDNVNVE